MASILPLKTPVKILGEVFVLQPILNKNLSLFFKIHSYFLEISLENGLVKLAKNVFFYLGKTVLQEKNGISDPP